MEFIPTYETKSGSYQFTLKIDVLDEDSIIQTELYTTTIQIEYVPDLYVGDKDISFSDTSLEQDQNTLINATVHNLGIVPAKNVTVEFLLTTKGGSLKQIGTVSLNEIPAGGSETASLKWNVDPATSTIIVKVDPLNTTMEVDEENNEGFYQSFFILQPPPQTPESKSGSGGGVAGIGTLGAVAVLTALISITSVMFVVTLSSEAGRYSFMSFFMPLYIMSKLSLTNGTLAHHLYTLEKQEFIKSERDGPYKRFYPHGYTFSGSVMEVNGVQKKIIDLVESHPGITQKELAKLLSISPPTVNYHIKALVGSRLVELQRNGKETKCFRIRAE
jgi:DNA-binding MarR family transcriptional regulator